MLGRNHLSAQPSQTLFTADVDHGRTPLNFVDSDSIERLPFHRTLRPTSLQGPSVSVVSHDTSDVAWIRSWSSPSPSWDLDRCRRRQPAPGISTLLSRANKLGIRSHGDFCIGICVAPQRRSSMVSRCFFSVWEFSRRRQPRKARVGFTAARLRSQRYRARSR